MRRTKLVRFIDETGMIQKLSPDIQVRNQASGKLIFAEYVARDVTYIMPDGKLALLEPKDRKTRIWMSKMRGTKTSFVQRCGDELRFLRSR